MRGRSGLVKVVAEYAQLLSPEPGRRGIRQHHAIRTTWTPHSQVASTGFVRHQAFVEPMTARGLTADEDLVVLASAYSIPAGEAAFAELLGRGDRFRP